MITLYVIYDRPSDYPDNFVVRAWKLDRFGKCLPSWDARLANDLESARSCIPKGHMRFPRLKRDDPVIVEVWM